MRTVLPALPWIGILLAICIVQLIRAQAFDALLFGIVALALLADASGLLPVTRLASPPLAVMVLVAVPVGIALVVSPRHGVVAGLAVALTGLACAPFAWTERPPRPLASASPSRSARQREAQEEEAERRRRVLLVRSAVAWAVVAVALCVLELVSFLVGRLSPQSSHDHPAISELLDPVVESWPGRVLFVAAWLGLGIVLVRAGRRAPDA